MKISSNSRWATAVGLLVCAVVMVMLPDVSAKRYIVGGNMGWTSNVNYTLWAGNQTFYLGDWLYFVYDRNQNDVLEVNKTNYETCNAEHPLHNYTTGAGRDVVPLNVTRHYYFISSKGFCYGGMKLHVHVINLPPPLAAPVKSHSSRFTAVKAWLFVSFVVAVTAIWDLLCS
ncbi:hypothetical protein L1887_10321 [Cichorium endivia]|nr:hypothetical protein L1887_10321 [Cichorium endivia]